MPMVATDRALRFVRGREACPAVLSCGNLSQIGERIVPESLQDGAAIGLLNFTGFVVPAPKRTRLTVVRDRELRRPPARVIRGLIRMRLDVEDANVDHDGLFGGSSCSVTSGAS